MYPFLFTLPTRIAFGPGAIDQVGAETARAGTRALLVTSGAFVRHSGLIDHISRSLADAQVTATVLDEMGRIPTIDSVDRGAARARELGADVIIGLGGGGALDAAKGIAAAAACGQSIDAYIRDGHAERPLVDQALPIVQVPIIASTGSETNDTAIILNPETMVSAPIRGGALYARSTIVDPTLTFTVPSRYAVVGAMNIVTQMLESYLTSDEFAAADRITEGLMRVVLDSLPRALRRSEDLDARTNLSWAAALASSIGAAGRSDQRPVRSLAHPLTGRFGLDHGATVAALWPSYMRYALSNRYRLPQVGRFKRYALLGRQIFGVHETDDEVAAETTAHRFENWLHGLDLPTNLRQLGLEEIPVSELADQVVTVSGNGHRLPSGLTAQDIEHIYDGALRPS